MAAGSGAWVECVRSPHGWYTLQDACSHCTDLGRGETGSEEWNGRLPAHHEPTTHGSTCNFPAPPRVGAGPQVVPTTPLIA